MPTTSSGIYCDRCSFGYEYADTGPSRPRPASFRLEKRYGSVSVLCERCAPPKDSRRPKDRKAVR